MADEQTTEATETASSINTTVVESNSLQIGKWANLFMAAAGVLVAWISRSDAILIDGLYSGVNFISAIVAASIGIRVAQAANRRYPFGYDALEPMYVTFRSIVLLGILSFAMFSAINKIIAYASGGDVPELVFGPIVVYSITMVTICFCLAAWHGYNWKRTNQQSELLAVESRAAVVDGVVSAGVGIGLVAALLLQGTALEFLLPIADSIIVLILAACIIRQPVMMLLAALRETAAGSAGASEVLDAKSCAEGVLNPQQIELVDIVVIKMGRVLQVVSYVNPSRSIEASEIDCLRDDLQVAFENKLNLVKSEVVITAKSPF